MRWRGGRRSQNVEDRRGARMPMGGGLRLGGSGILLVLLAAWLFGANPLTLLQILAGGGSAIETSPDDGYEQPAPAPGGATDEGAEFVSVVLADTEDTWNEIFASGGERYAAPKLVLFSDVVRSACGTAQSAMGPFYCPLDQKVYIDLVFYRDLRERFRAPGDFAQAYVIAHEVGHHVQTLLGTSQKVRDAQQRMGQEQANALSVRLELQADCYAGVWAHHAHRARQILEQGDVEEGLGAAAAIGDDRIQRQTQGTVVPESFTHGSSAQRVTWFRRGLESGSMQSCDTFAAGSP
ncbi:MAG: flagellar biosynthesis protein FlgM [Proteobacteria bacterium]|nr:MAG: flagellar biosynthesis protein FlgM [Pseudomonadota bacterium]